MLFDLLLVAMLVAANGFFVASEFAIVKIRPTRLQELAQKGSARAKIALGITNNMDAYLSANQLGITMASLALGWIGESAFSRMLEPLFGGSPATSHALAVTFSLISITFLHTVLGEQAPKLLAIQRAEGVTLWTAIPLRAFYVIAFPIIWTLNTASTLVLRLIGLKRSSEDVLHSPEEMRVVLKDVAIEPSARAVIDRVFDYAHHLARHVMALRSDVVVLDADKSFEQNLATALAQQYTRYPLYQTEGDRILGYIHIKDIFAAAMMKGQRDLRKLARQPIYCFEDTPLEEIRREIQKRGIHLVVVLDASGTFAGVLTLEDLVEQFVGEIRDEQDQGELPRFALGPQDTFEAEGQLTLDVLKREAALDLAIEEADSDIDTLGGFVMHRLGGIPHVGDSIDAAGYRLTVLSMRGRRVLRVRGEKRPESPTAEE